VGDCGTHDMPVIPLQEDSDFLPGRVRHLQANRLTRPRVENRHRTEDICLLECPSTVLPANDRGPVQAIVADQEQCPIAGACADRDGQSRRPSLEVNRCGGLLAQRRLS
jgi:hypothetical protein